MILLSALEWRVLGALWLGSMTAVVASPHVASLKERSVEDIDKLFMNIHGQSPCPLLNALAAPCTNTGNITSPIPSPCSCNNVFFNVRSACLLSEGGSTSAPKFSDWNDACQKESVSVTTGYPDQYKGDSNPVPYWAFVPIRSNGEFDFDAAVAAAKPKGWTMLQIMLPVLSAAVTILLGVLLYLYVRYRASLKRFRGPVRRGWFKTKSPARIHTAGKSNSWTIDRTDSSGQDNLDAASYPHVEYGSPAPAHLPSAESFTILDKPLYDEPDAIPSHGPGTWDRLAQKFRQLPEQIPMPFKQRAVGVKDAEPSSRFRINSVDGSSAGHSLSSGRRSGRRPGRSGDLPQRWRGLITDDDQFHGSSEGHQSIEEEEEESLITHTERSENHVYLITNRDTANFSSDHGSHLSSQVVKIEPPTPTASSRDSARHSLPPGPPPQMALPPLPPPPRIPPPSPPAFVSRLPPIRQEPSQESLNLQATTSRTRPTPTKQPSADSIQLSVLSPTLSHQNSQNSQNSRRRQRSNDDPNDDTGSIRARPLGARSPARSVRQLSVDEDAGTSNANSSMQRPQHKRIVSAGNEGFEGEHFQPLAVPVMHRRNLSSDSLTPLPGDPIRLFPGAVRGAGYGTHLTGTESSASFYSTQTYDAPSSPPPRLPPDSYHQRPRT